MKDDIDRLMMGIGKSYSPGDGPKGDLYSQTVTYYGNRYTVNVATVVKDGEMTMTGDELGFLGVVKARLGLVTTTNSMLAIELEVIGDEEGYGGEVLTDPYLTSFLLDSAADLDNVDLTQMEVYSELREVLENMIDRSHREALYRR